MSEVWDKQTAGSGLQEIENDPSCFPGLAAAWISQLNGTLVSELLTWATVDFSLATPSHHQNCQQVGFHLVVITLQDLSSHKSKSSLRYFLTIA